VKSRLKGTNFKWKKLTTGKIRPPPDEENFIFKKKYLESEQPIYYTLRTV